MKSQFHLNDFVLIDYKCDFIWGFKPKFANNFLNYSILYKYWHLNYSLISYIKMILRA
jgi:hypothetical protein